MFRFVLLVPFLAAALAMPARAATAPARLTALESSAGVFNVLYHYADIRPGPGGAYGANIGSPRVWYIEEQRAGSVDVIAGVLRQDPSLIRQGLEMFHWGLARETANGAFPRSAWPFHSVMLFLSEATPALLILKQSQYAREFHSELVWETARIDRAAWHAEKIVGRGKVDDPTKNHRFFEAALGLMGAGRLARDRRLVSRSRLYARRGIRMSRPNGIMPEDGGHDSGYQAVGLNDAIRFLTLDSNAALDRSLRAAISRAERWELSRVRGNGTINQTGDTRTNGCEERSPDGACKTTFYAPIFAALARWAALSGDQTYQLAAYHVWLQNWAHMPGDVLPTPGLFASTRTVQPGQTLTVWGTRFQPLEVVQVFFGGKLVATATCDQIGSFGGRSATPNAKFVVPPTAGGTVVVRAVGDNGTRRRIDVTIQ